LDVAADLLNCHQRRLNALEGWRRRNEIITWNVGEEVPVLDPSFETGVLNMS
jgi:hypothetical protein